MAGYFHMCLYFKIFSEDQKSQKQLAVQEKLREKHVL